MKITDAASKLIDYHISYHRKHCVLPDVLKVFLSVYSLLNYLRRSVRRDAALCDEIRVSFVMIFRAITESPKLIVVPGFTKWQNAEHYFFWKGQSGGVPLKNFEGGRKGSLKFKRQKISCHQGCG